MAPKEKGKKKSKVAPDALSKADDPPDDEISPEERKAKEQALKVRAAESYMSDGHRRKLLAAYQVKDHCWLYSA